LPSLNFFHVDVFSPKPYSGNSIPVFYDAPSLTTAQLLEITQELRHFEAIFLQPTSTQGLVDARVFDMFEELAFAGHPLIGAAAALSYLNGPPPEGAWTLNLSNRYVRIETRHEQAGFAALLDAGEPELFAFAEDRETVACAFSLSLDCLDPSLPLEVASTGLRYLVVPLRPDRIADGRVKYDLTELLNARNAQFAILFDPQTREVRHWNNDGVVEDVATGSAAGAVAAYCVKHGLAPTGEIFQISQGRFVGRPTKIDVRVDRNEGQRLSVKIGGAAAVLGHGTLYHVPEIEL
jgi:trans-2,3-dihydro-3-hydroxyanthranilate isomerase